MEDYLVKFESVGLCFKRQSRLMKSKKQKLFWALENVTFELSKGEVLGIVGRNGSGKSTILSIIAGILGPDRGKFFNNNASAALLSLQAGFVDYLSGRKNIMISGLLLGMSKAEVLAKIDDIIEFSELGDFIDEPVEAYSAGMKTRLGFSTALYIQPDILLIDEVLGVGDRKFKEKSYNALKKKLSGEMAAVIVSHDEEEILDLCDRVIWIDQGVCRLSGDPHYVINEMNASS